jgi:hypothetical protein
MPAYTNEFAEPEYYDHVIRGDGKGAKVGTLRIKPSAILWKPAGKHDFCKVSLQAFAEWITDPSTAASKVKQ